MESAGYVFLGARDGSGRLLTRSWVGLCELGTGGRGECVDSLGGCLAGPFSTRHSIFYKHIP